MSFFRDSIFGRVDGFDRFDGFDGCHNGNGCCGFKNGNCCGGCNGRIVEDFKILENDVIRTAQDLRRAERDVFSALHHNHCNKHCCNNGCC